MAGKVLSGGRGGFDIVEGEKDHCIVAKPTSEEAAIDIGEDMAERTRRLSGGGKSVQL
ncbi:hypothetical protein HPP92_005788 [Vanilla planifolia]|uniref:Uncharacterized protein n=1 Tax=Vanilla planifolia TaxID=51239 RepID=A0A835RQ74_VANPL|nr:hypothetical protein HPP92_005788 [Vanilla planifolia]